MPLCSCDGGNLVLLALVAPGRPFPRLALYARRDIVAGEELRYAYGPPSSSPLSRPCLCGTRACRGRLPCSP